MTQNAEKKQDKKQTTNRDHSYKRTVVLPDGLVVAYEDYVENRKSYCQMYIDR